MSFLSWTVQSSQIRAGAQCSGPKYPQNEPQNELSSVPFSLLLSLSLQSCAQVTILQTRITVTTIKSIAWAHNLPVSSSAEACCLPNGSGASGTEFGLQGGAMREEVTPQAEQPERCWSCSLLPAITWRISGAEGTKVSCRGSTKALGPSW